MKKILFSLLIALSISTFAAAQQGKTAVWNQENVATAAQAQGFTYRLYVQAVGNTGPGSPTALTSVSCTLSGTTAACTAPIPTTVTGLTTGAQVFLTVQDTASGGAESALSLPFRMPTAVPTNLKLIP